MPTLASLLFLALILFAGGDGTARDVYAVTGDRMPILGIPTGVKMQSAVFATAPEAAGDLVAAIIAMPDRGRLQYRQSEVMDIDEDELRRGVIAPRLFASVIALPLMVLAANAIGIFGGWLLAVQKLGFNSVGYLAISREYLSADDFKMAIIKAGVFGFMLALMGCYHGHRTIGGAAGVGNATRNAVVSAFMLILGSNFLITAMVFS